MESLGVFLDQDPQLLHDQRGGRGWALAFWAVTYAAELADDLALALAMADAADVVTLDRYQSLDLVVETKPDLTPVSDADRATEQLLRDHLAKARPHDPVLGEEMGADTSITSGRRWILDPIDGTKNYVRGVPVWATLIALVDGADVVVGVVSAPALGRRWWAAKGAGAWAGGLLVGAPKQIHVSEVGQLADASLSYSDAVGWPDGGAAFRDLAGRCWRTRAYGDFWSHLLVAEGAVDVSAEPEVSIWDVAALVVILEEAGGRVTGVDGAASPFAPSIVCTNGLLHVDVLGYLEP
jgi:histidinol-phosphatase